LGLLAAINKNIFQKKPYWLKTVLNIDAVKKYFETQQQTTGKSSDVKNIYSIPNSIMMSIDHILPKVFYSLHNKKYVMYKFNKFTRF
jgi:hypothetical protein